MSIYKPEAFKSFVPLESINQLINNCLMAR